VDMSVAYADFMVEAGSWPTGLERYLRLYA
jgi:hypothetical protein